MTLVSFVCLCAMYFTAAVVFHFAKSDGVYMFSTLSAQTVAELVKLCISIVLLNQEIGDKSLVETIKRQGSDIGVSLPSVALSVLYCVNNQLTFVLFTMVTAMDISLFKSMTPILTAILGLFIFNRNHPPASWLTLAIQGLGLVMAQYNSGKVKFDSESYLIAFIAVGISACTSVFNAELIKRAGERCISMHVVNVIMYVTGFSCNYLYFLVSGRNGFFYGYTATTVLIIFVNSVLGVAVTFVYRYSDATTKTLAQTTNICLLLLIGLDSELKIDELVGVLVTCMSTCVYFMTDRETAGSNKMTKLVVILAVAAVVAVASCVEQPQQPQTRPQIAVCMTGAVRSLALPKVYQNIEKRLGEIDGDVHLFMFVKRTDDPRKEFSTRFDATEEELKEAVDYLRPVWVEEDNDDYSSLLDVKKYNRKCKTNLSDRVIPQFAPIRTCQEAAENYGRFDWFIRIRPDIVYLDPLPPLATWDKASITVPSVHSMASQVNDHVLIMPWKHSHVIATVTNYLTRIKTCPPIGVANPEVVLQSYVEFNDVKIIKTPIFEVLVRRREGPDCFRRNSKEEKQRCKQFWED